MNELGKAVAASVMTLLAGEAGADSLPACTTGSEVAGYAVEGTLDLLEVPEGMARVDLSPSDGIEYPDRTVSNAGIVIFSELAVGDEILVFARPGQAGLDHVVTFLDAADKRLERCALRVMAFDPDLHDPARIARGACGGEVPLKLTSGQEVVIDLPEEHRDQTTMPTSVLSTLSISATRIRLTAGVPGAAAFAWVGEDDGDGALKGLCPVEVSAPTR